MRRTLPMLLATMLLIAPVALSQEDQPDKPASPAKPQATLADDAKPVVESLAAAYSSLKTLQLDGTFRLQLTEADQPRSRQASFTSAFVAPNRFRHQADDQPVLGSTGKKVYGYSPANNAFSQADAPSADEKPSIEQLPEDHARILPAQNLSLLLALAKDPAAELRQLATAIAKGADQTIDGKAYTTLELTRAEDRGKLTLLIDPQTHLIRRTVEDLTPMLAKRGRPDLKEASFTVDFTASKVGGDVKPELFAWSPPPGAKDLLAIRAAAADGDDEGAASALVGKPAPDFTLKDLDDKDVTLTDHKNAVVLLDFWATWCGPCVAAMPNLEKLHKDLSKDGLKIYAVNLREDKEKVSAFLKKHSLTLPVLFDKEGQVAKQFAVEGIPQTVLIGRDGTIRKVWIGFNPAEEAKMREVIVQELKARPAGAQLIR